MAVPRSRRWSRASGVMNVRQDRGEAVSRTASAQRLRSRAGAVLAILALAIGIAGDADAQVEKARIAFVGDSTSDGLWGGMSQLVSRDACLKASVELGRYAKNSTGLTRPDRFDWAQEVRKVGESFKPKLFVMSLGLNDRQSVVEKGQITLENSPFYPDKYKERVTAVLRNVTPSNAALLWVGLAAMRAAAADKDAREKNRLFEEAIRSFGVATMRYVEPWRLNPLGPDTFASYGPDHNGKMIQLRASDGEHFTPAGDLVVAAYLLPKITATLAVDGVALCTKTEGQSQ